MGLFSAFRGPARSAVFFPCHQVFHLDLVKCRFLRRPMGFSYGELCLMNQSVNVETYFHAEILKHESIKQGRRHVAQRFNGQTTTRTQRKPPGIVIALYLTNTQQRNYV